MSAELVLEDLLGVEGAERSLRDNLVDGVAAELFWADKAYALAEEIGQPRQTAQGRQPRAIVWISASHPV
jgi:hypothetical protein